MRRARQSKEDRFARSSGFSILEALIAAALVAVIAAGVAPLFTRAMVSNRAGQESTEVSHLAKSKLEELIQLPFNSPELLLESGTERVEREYLEPGEEQWTDGEPPSGHPVEWVRTTTLRQYGITVDPSTGQTRLSEPLDASVRRGKVHLREIVVSVESGREDGPMGIGKRISVRYWKAQ